LGAIAVLCAGCAPDQPAPTSLELSAPLFVSSGTGNMDANFGTHLFGREEVPARATRAQGQAIFRVSDDGMSVDYKLIVANIENVFMAHIHLAPAGQNGGIIVWLHPSTVPNVRDPVGQGRIDGVIAEGTFNKTHLVGALAGKTISDLLAEIQAGRTYVNVHTDDGVAPINTGPR
jgi:hypothetical protein